MGPLRLTLPPILASLLITCVIAAPAARANTLTIMSTPPGATVVIDGVTVGSTPYEAKFPGGYFHKTHTVFGQRLEHPMVARISKEGFTTKEIELTYGPLPWVAVNGRYHGNYWLLKSEHFSVVLEPLSKVFTGKVAAALATAPRVSMRPEMPIEQVVQVAGPAIVLVQTPEGSGTGFFVTETGVIATNAHVARESSNPLVITPAGAQLAGRVVYVDAELDLALLKVDGTGFPHLPLAELATVRPGETVVAIGNPARALPNTVTKGIVSAVGPKAQLGPGIWIQTDAAINPGNSGGPLLNTSGEVVGITTRKEFRELGAEGRPLQGIGFALSASDLLEVLRRFYPNVSAGEAAQTEGSGTVSVSSEPSGAEIYVDGKFVGNTPSAFKLAAGQHRIAVKTAGRQAWERELEVLKDSQVNLHPQLAAQP